MGHALFISKYALFKNGQPKEQGIALPLAGLPKIFQKLPLFLVCYSATLEGVAWHVIPLKQQVH